MEGYVAVKYENKVERKNFESLPLKENQLRVKIHATALNRADLLQKAGLYPPPPGETEVLGLEMAGEVSEVGAKVKNWKVGDRICALLAGGGYATEVIIDQNMAIPIPRDWSYQEAAGLPEAFLTAFLNLEWVTKLQAEEVILIHAGASGVGTAAIQLAKRIGATVIATAGSDVKCSFCKQLGADVVINYKKQNFVDVIHSKFPQGVDVILDFVGAAYWEKNASVSGMGTRWILLGVLGGAEVEKVNLLPILQKNIRIEGSTLRSKSHDYKIELTKAFSSKYLNDLNSRKLRPILDKTYSWYQVEEAFTYVEANKNIGKVILEIS